MHSMPESTETATAPSTSKNTATLAALPAFELATPELLHAEVADDPDYAGLISLDSQGNGQLFTPDEADASADRVIGWGRQVKTMAGRLRHDAGALTEQQTTLTYDPECGWFRTAPVETRMRNIDTDATVAENSQLPFLAAQVVVTDWDRGTDGRTVDGRFTAVWIHYGTSTGELSPAGARKTAAEIREFADRLDALCDRAEEIAVDDHQERA